MKIVRGGMLLACLLTGARLWAQPETAPLERFQQANQAYSQGDYAKAAAGYRDLLQAGYDSAGLHANLAQALFREGQLGAALYEMLQAHAARPRHPEIAANLAALRARARDQITPAPRSRPRRWLEGIGARLSPRELWALFAGSALLFWGLASAALFRRSLGLRWGLILAGSVALTAAAGLVHQHFFLLPAGVVTAKEVSAYSAPGAEHVVLFQLHAGAEFRIRARRDGGWLSIELADGKRGWLPCPGPEQCLAPPA